MGLLVNTTKQTEPLWIGWNPTSNSEGGESFVVGEVQGRGEGPNRIVFWPFLLHSSPSRPRVRKVWARRIHYFYPFIEYLREHEN